MRLANSAALLLCLILCAILSAGPICFAANPYQDESIKPASTTGTGNGKSETTVVTENGITNTPTPTRPGNEPPALNPPPEPGKKGITTASPEFKTWLQKVRPQVDAWNFPEGIVNTYGQTITRDDFLKAIIWIESNGVHKSPKGRITTSYVGALGFMQLMPSTAKGLGCDAKDPGQNLLAGCK
ncbi:MAG TPA: lytic transglycosylase domain-containing protein, partial [Candidatus Ozemobacteraceae bacterium]|nr:lytic transglycosylase domain-containing protein [Candidatus Ozemobacteraceae bacterium]